MMKYARLPFNLVLLMTALLFAHHSSAVERSCKGEVYAQSGLDSVTLFQITATGKSATVNEARRLAMSRLTRCSRGIWKFRWNLLGSTWVTDVPHSCRDVEGFHSWDIDVKSRIVAGACKLWSTRIHDKTPFYVQINLQTYGAEGCGDGNELHATQTFSKNYQITPTMCANGY